MTDRDHDNRSEKNNGHATLAAQNANHKVSSKGHQGTERGGTQARSGADQRHDGKGHQDGGGDGAGGAPKAQGQGGHPDHHRGGPGQHD